MEPYESWQQIEFLAFNLQHLSLECDQPVVTSPSLDKGSLEEGSGGRGPDRAPRATRAGGTERSEEQDVLTNLQTHSLIFYKGLL